APEISGIKDALTLERPPRAAAGRRQPRRTDVLFSSEQSHKRRAAETKSFEASGSLRGEKRKPGDGVGKRRILGASPKCRQGESSGAYREEGRPPDPPSSRWPAPCALPRRPERRAPPRSPKYPSPGSRNKINVFKVRVCGQDGERAPEERAEDRARNMTINDADCWVR
ncbi:Hypothetical predicted protein, partial [Lynx pardinus]